MAADLWEDPETGQSLSPPPLPDAEASEGITQFGRLRITRNGVQRQVANLGFGGILVDWADFKKFLDYLDKNIFEEEQEKVVAHKQKVQAKRRGSTHHQPMPHTPFRPTSQSLDFGISLLWPSQSFASITLFRGPAHRRLGEFHHQRFRALAGQH